MRKIELEHKLYTVVTADEYSKERSMYSPKSTAIICDKVVLPIRGQTESGPGVYVDTSSKPLVHNVRKPKQPQEYSVDKMIDFNNSRDIGDVIKNNELLSNLQNDLMVSGRDGNIFYLNVTPNDTPEMAALKNAINAKQVDKKSYEQRFSQFQNDMRLLKGNTITLGKLISICDGFDIACTLTLTDREGAVNPMDTEIVVDLTENRPIKSRDRDEDDD